MYQPIVDLARRSVVGYEALTRFQPPDGRRVDPSTIFAAAHELGLGADLDAVCMQAALAHRPDLPGNCFLTVNVDPISLGTAPVTRVFGNQGDLSGVVIEITEHQPWNWAELKGPINRLRAQGAMFAVDDAGAGYAGLHQILLLRPSILKLDKALIEDLDRDEAKVALVEMLGLFANRVDAWILAEGVERREEAQRLIDLEVPLAQGFFFSRPAPPWAGVDPDAALALAEAAANGSATLHALLDPVAAVTKGQNTATAWLSNDEPWAAVVDERRRPLGLLNTESALSGELVTTLVVNVGSSPLEVGQRLTTAIGEPAAPVIVVDNAGRYLGLVTLRRLIGALTRSHESPVVLD